MYPLEKDIKPSQADIPIFFSAFSPKSRRYQNFFLTTDPASSMVSACSEKGVYGVMGSWFWWVKILVIGIFSALFLVFGIEVLIGSYSLKQPQFFIMYFFSGSFITLISLVGVLYPVFQIYAFLTQGPTVHDDD
jgi:hypothetical protein